MTIKRWITGLLAVALFLSGIAGAEKDYDLNSVEIQESVISPEGEQEKNTLTDNVKLFRELINNEDVRSLFQIQDVKDLTNEIVLKILVWMLQNRPVTMQILKELGASEQDLRCIDKIWDSWERIRSAESSYWESEDGRKLAGELEALHNDPEMVQAWERFVGMATSGDVTDILKEIKQLAEERTETEHLPEGELTREALKRQIEYETIAGQLIIKLIGVVEESEWARESIPQMLQNESLWTVLTHTAQISELDAVLQNELVKLMRDNEVSAFLEITAQEVLKLFREMKAEMKQEQTQKGKHPVTVEGEP